MKTDIQPLKRSDYSEDVELVLRKNGKDYCEKCGNFVHGSEVSPDRLERWVSGKEKVICPTCRNIFSVKRRIVILAALLLAAIVTFIII
jgi:hypothetical protein